MFYSQEELLKFNFKSLGKDVRIDTTCIIINPELLSIGNNSRIDAFCLISGLVTLENNIHIAPFCLINGGKLGITIRAFSGFAYGVKAFTASDDYSGKTLTGPTIPLKYKNVYEKAILIDKHCIIGTNSLVFPGVTLAVGTSVGAMSLINKDTLPWKIYFGIPAKPLADRSSKVLELEKEYLKSNFID